MELSLDDLLGTAPPKPNLPRGKSADPTLLAESIALKKAQREKVELQNARARGELLDARAVELEWSAVLVTIRGGLLALPSRVAQRLPHVTTHDISVIDHEVRAVLQELGGADI